MTAAIKFWLAQQIVGLGVFLGVVLLIVATMLLAMAYERIVNGWRKWRWRDHGYRWDAAKRSWVKP
jgi:hypothetical protein